MLGKTSLRRSSCAFQRLVLVAAFFTLTKVCFADILGYPTNVTLSAGANCTAVLPDLTSQVDVLNSSPYTVTQFPLPGLVLPLGFTNLTFSVTDTNGMNVTVTSLVEVADTTPPNFDPLPNKTAGCSETWSFDEASAADSCSTFTLSLLSTVTNSTGSGSYVAIRTWQAIDAHNNTSTASQTVTVGDTSLPIITHCPTNRSVIAGSNCRGLVPDVSSEVVTAPMVCGTPVIIQNPAPGTELPIGLHSITVTAQGVALSANCSFSLQIIDKTAPAILTDFTNVILSAGANCKAALPDLASAVEVKECSNFTVTQAPLPGALLSLGTNEVVFTATDAGGLSATATQLVVVVDITPPVFLPLTDRTVQCSDVWTFSTANAVDSCGPSPVTVLDTVTNTTGVTGYVAARTWRAIDAFGNTSYATQTVTVSSSGPAISSCPTNRTLGVGANCILELPDFRSELVVNACGGVVVSQSPNPGVQVPIGSHVIELTVQNPTGDSVSCSFTLQVVDNTAPVVGTLTNRTLSADSTCQAILADLTGDVSVQDCSSYSITQAPLPGTALTLGTNEIVFTVVDLHGLTKTASQLVIVKDTTPPEFAPLSNETVQCSDAWVFATPIATDLCSTNAITVVSTSTNATGAGIQVATRVWRAIDAYGNTATATQQVTILDSSTPVITSCPPNRTLGMGANCVLVLPDFTSEVVATAQCGAAQVSQKPSPGTQLNAGSHVITFTAATVGHKDTCTMTLEVVDASAPVVASLTNVVLSAGLNCKAVLPDLTTNVAAQDCGAYTVTQLPLPGVELTLGTNEVVFTVTDEHGLSSTAAQSVIVADTTPPDFAPLSNLSVHCTDSWTFGAATATDLCGTNTVSVLETVTNRSSAISYVAKRIWQAVDAYGNTSTATQTVTVAGFVPVITVCPQDRSMFAAANCLAILPDLTGEVSASTICGGITVSQSPVPGTKMRIGPNLITFSVRNEGGDTATCAINLEVVDNIPPAIASTTTFTVSASNCTFRLPDLTTEVIAVDCTPFTITQLPLPGIDLPLGTNEIVFTVVDSSGLSSSRAGAVIVMDTTPPVFNLSTNVIFLGAGANCLATVPDLTTTPAGMIADDPCSSISISQSPAPGASLPLGAHEVLFAAQDAAGNVATQSVVLQIVDNTAPIVSFPTNLTVQAELNCLGVLPDLTTNLLAEDCHPFAIAQSPLPGTIVALGTNLITFTVQDSLSNTAVLVQPVAVVLPPSANTNLSISEFMAKNLSSLTDEDGAHSDWIEIHNAGGCPMDLSGWALTDDAKKPTKWKFPSTNIAAGAFLVIWASEKNHRTPGAPLHTNFKLSDEGEYLALVAPNGVITTQFAPTFPPQLPDATYGLGFGATTNDYLAFPTPGTQNSAATNFAIVPLTFKPSRGWYTNPVEVALSTPTKYLVSGVTIYYTTNGSVPSPTNGLIYTQPILISSTKVLRAAAFAPGMIPTTPQSHSYLFPLQVEHQTGAGFPPKWGSLSAIYQMHPVIVNDPQWRGLIPGALISLPTVSMSLNVDEMFGTNGIYANPFGDGDAWERGCSIEYLRNDSQPGFQIDCGVQLEGDLSRDPDWTMKHNFRLYFKSAYGPSKLFYDLYPDSPVEEFNTLVLHASFNDHWYTFDAKAQMIRDQWVADTQREIEGYGTHGNYVNLYINGLYWGLYNLGERPDAAYAATHFGGLRSDYDGFNGDEIKDGTTNARNEMLTIVKAGVTNDASYAELGRYLDLPAFANYMLINMYAANLDWPIHNFWVLGSVTNGVPFRFLSWDAEVTFYGVNWDLTGVNTGTPGLIYQALLKNPNFRQLFADHAHRLLFNRGALTPGRTEARWMRRAQEIDQAIIAESARWGVTWRTNTHTDWLREQNLLRTQWFPTRTDILISQLRAAKLYPDLDAPVFNPDSGVISEEGPLPLVMSAPVGNIYYTTNGADPRLPDGSISPEALLYHGPLALRDEVQVRARTFTTNTWSAITEADYARAALTPSRFEMITRRIDGSVELNLSGAPGVSYHLYSSTNLIDWEQLVMIIPDVDGKAEYLDTAAAHKAVRFYKLSSP